MAKTDISLIEWTERNAAARVPVLNNPQVYRFLSPFLPLPYTEAHSLEFLRACTAQDLYEYAIVTEGEIIGSIGGSVLKDDENRQFFELGYYLAPSHWRQGFMSRAIPLFLKKLRQAEPQLSYIRARVFDFNIASQHLLMRCGFTHRPHGELLTARDGLEHRLFLYVLNFGTPESHT